MSFPRAASADIGLLLEGTYPYIGGGVSAWVDQIIRAFPERSFALAFIGSRGADYREPRYRLPDNVVHLETCFIHDPAPARKARSMGGAARMRARLEQVHEKMRSRQTHGQAAALADIGADMAPGCPLDEEMFYRGRLSWDYLTEQYRKHSTEPSFVDYFWTVRIMHQPLWRLHALAAGFPRVKAYHSVSTGYAGLLGAMLKLRDARPYLLSEHGIYTKERKIDLFQAQWIRDSRNVFMRDTSEIGYIRQMWIRFFEALGRIAYDAADHITSLFEANRRRQLADGAPAAKTRCIPNGVDVPRFAVLRAKRAPGVPQVMCLIGRVVPIKDVRAFIRAAQVLLRRLPHAEAWIAGPTEEDPSYAADCRDLAQTLGLADKVRFLGFQNVDELLPKVGVLVLSSISEGLPLVVLEGYAAGVPAVTTDVGACRQLVHGAGAEDEALGSAGSVVGIADPEALGEAAAALLSDESRWRAAQAAAISRVERYYRLEEMVSRFRELYEWALASPSRPIAAAAGAQTA